MVRGPRLLPAIAVLSLVPYAPLFAQNRTGNSQNSAPPASTASAAAQTDQAASANNADKKDSTTQASAPKRKKVWTNDDLSEMHNDPSVSVVGKKKNSQPEDKYRYSPPPGQSEYMLKMYRQQLDQLQAQAEAIDKEISNLQSAKSGKTVESTRNYDPWGGKQGDWDAQIAQLRKNKEYVQQQIDNVEEQIRKLN